MVGGTAACGTRMGLPARPKRKISRTDSAEKHRQNPEGERASSASRDLDREDRACGLARHAVDAVRLADRVRLRLLDHRREVGMDLVGVRSRGVEPLENFDRAHLDARAVPDADVEVDGHVRTMNSGDLRRLDGAPDIVLDVLVDDLTFLLEVRVDRDHRAPARPYPKSRYKHCLRESRKRTETLPPATTGSDIPRELRGLVLGYAGCPHVSDSVFRVVSLVLHLSSLVVVPAVAIDGMLTPSTTGGGMVGGQASGRHSVCGERGMGFMHDDEMSYGMQMNRSACHLLRAGRKRLNTEGARIPRAKRSRSQIVTGTRACLERAGGGPRPCGPVPRKSRTV